jgi:hypothetical protein
MEIFRLIRSEANQIQSRRNQRAAIISAVKSGASQPVDPVIANNVVAACRQWICANALASSALPQFSDEVVVRSANSFAVRGAVTCQIPGGESTRNWYVARLDSRYAIVYADMIDFDPAILDSAPAEQSDAVDFWSRAPRFGDSQPTRADRVVSRIEFGFYLFFIFALLAFYFLSGVDWLKGLIAWVPILIFAWRARVVWRKLRTTR